MAHRRVPVPIVESLARRTDEYRRHLLIEGYREMVADCCHLLPQSPDPDPPAPRLSRHLAALDECMSLPARYVVLSGWDVLRTARRRALL